MAGIEHISIISIETKGKWLLKNCIIICEFGINKSIVNKTDMIKPNNMVAVIIRLL